MFVDHASPPAALLAEDEPTTRSAAEPIGSGAVAPPASEAPTTEPAGAAAVMPSGRSAGANAGRGTVSAEPAASLLRTGTCSGRGAGGCPAAAVAELTPARAGGGGTAGA